MKLDPPSDVQSNVSSDHCVLTWSVRPALEPLASLLSYELAFKRQEEAWEVTPGALPGGSSQGRASCHQGDVSLDDLTGGKRPEPRLCARKWAVCARARARP